MGTGIPLETFLGPLAPEHLSEVVVGFILAALLAVVVQKVVVPRFEKLYDDRHEQIQGGINRAKTVEAEAAAMKREYEKQMEDSRREAAETRQKANAEAKQILEEARQRSIAERDAMLDSAAKQIEAERASAFNRLTGEIGSLSAALTEKIMRDQLIDEARQRKIIDEFIADLANEPSRRSLDCVSEA